MEITQLHIDIFYARVCPYCSSETKDMTETDIYGKEYSGRKVIACKNYPKCDAYVGCHKTGEPLGRLANKSLREAKVLAHSHFDKIWKSKVIKRGELYKMLSLYLNIPSEYTHIGMFKKETCLEVVKWSEDIYKQIIVNKD